MRAPPVPLLPTTAAALLLAASAALADGIVDNIGKAIDQGDAAFTFRYRYESVDQEPFKKAAQASTLLSRLTWKSGLVKGVSGLFEVDNLSYLGGETFNNTANGKVAYPVIADPDHTELNQAWLSYVLHRGATLSAGRQRINHGAERFLGGVSFRQNEQTFDATRVQLKPLPGLAVDYAYIWNVNRIFDPDTSPGDFAGDTALGDLQGDNHALLATYDLGGGHSLAAFGYLLDFDELPKLSSKTLGAEYKGVTKLSESLALTVNLAAARQQEYRDSPLDYSAPYYFAEVTAQMTPVRLAGGAGQATPISFGVGYEVLGSDDGASFQTPLATLHKFQGFADKFLTTPPDGIEDAYVKAGITLAGIGLTAFYHDFQADRGGDDYGNEIDLVANYVFNPHFSGQLKYATYHDGELVTAQDTDKVWLMLTATF